MNNQLLESIDTQVSGTTDVIYDYLSHIRNVNDSSRDGTYLENII